MERAGAGSARPQPRDQDSVEAWLDDHWDFTFSYFVRKATREMVNAWFAERVHTIPICKEGSRGHTESCSCLSLQSPLADSSVPGTPTRKISASEFDRPLRPIVVKDSEGTVSFLSDSEKKEQMPLNPPKFDNDEGDQCSRLLELVKDISSHLDVTALCHKIFLHIHGLISADRYSLFLVCEDSSHDKFLISRLFDVAEGSTLEEASNNCIRLEWNKGIVGHVAALGEPLNIKDAYEDPRFNAEVDQITGYKTQSILCMPIKNHREEVVGVAQAINKKSGNGGTFTEKDEKDFAAYLAFCGIVLHNAQLYETSLLENKRNQVLLDLASLIFEEQQSLEVILKKIAATIISFMQVQKCTIFIVDDDCSDSFSSVFHMECEELEKSSDTLTREHDANRINYMYAQYVKNTMEPLNIPDVREDRRFPWTLENTGNVNQHCIRSLLCTPIKNGKKNKVIGTDEKRMFSAIKKRLDGHSRPQSIRKSPPFVADTYSEATTSCEGSLLLHGQVELRRGRRRQQRHLFLLSDALLLCKTKYKHFFKIKNKVPLNTVWTADSMGKANIDGQRSFVLGWPTVNFVATFRSPELKEKWYSFLQRYINLAKEKDLPKRTSLKIFTEDIKNCASSITIRITNSDTVNDIINMSLPVLGITGSEKDYQLWVSSDKEKTPYPLIGHEHPYGIKTSLLPAMFVPQELQDSIFSFILKPRHLARNQQRDSGWKRVKKSVVAHLACWKSSSASQDNPSPAPPPAKPRQLFGISMMDICDDDKLLNPILDMLAFINEKGPLTKGVFRPETNRKSCRALKKKLKSGKKVNWDGESVLVAAAVLKDFLQTIEGSLFSSSLYDKWLAIPDQGESEDDKITATRRLLDQLPRANAVLLRCLFGVLRNIEQHSKYNEMTAFGLSMYIAPSLLYLPGTCNTDLGNNMKKKISLVEFLIENCHKIFGEDATSLLGKSSVNGGTSEATDSCWKTIKKNAIPHQTCWQDSSTSQDQPCPPQTPAKPRQLFGISMMDICGDDKLLNPILSMLAFINEKGPLRKGVFRTPTHMKSGRELKEKLNSGKKVNWNSESIFVIVAVLKDFLQNIEGSLFSSSLYDRWLAVPCQGKREDEKITATRRLLDQLPRANAVLLQCLFGVLYNIKQHSSYNEMTAFALSQHIAPSLLCLPNPCSTEAGMYLMKRISLVEFLIENCHKIFGEDATSLLGKSSVNGGTSEATVTTEQSSCISASDSDSDSDS